MSKSPAFVQQLLGSYLGLALLPIDNLGWNNLGGSGLRTRAHAFGLGDNHLGDGSRGCDDGWFGPLNGLQALLTLRKRIRFISERKLCFKKEKQESEVK